MNFIFPYILGKLQSQLTKLIFFRGVGIPPTSNLKSVHLQMDSPWFMMKLDFYMENPGENRCNHWIYGDSQISWTIHGGIIWYYDICRKYPLVNVYTKLWKITMLLKTKNSLFLWPCSIVTCMLDYQRVCIVRTMSIHVISLYSCNFNIFELSFTWNLPVPIEHATHIFCCLEGLWVDRPKEPWA